MSMEQEKRDLTPEEELPEAPPPQKPIIVLKAASNAQALELLLQKPENVEILPLEPSDIMEKVAALKVVHGINDELIGEICKNPVYNSPRIIAEGVLPQKGKDGYVDYLIPTEKNLRPKLREDGTVDYRDLGLIHNVTKGQVLCDIHPAEKGDDGMDIYGKLLNGTFGRDVPKIAGKNTSISEDKLHLIADTDGNVEVKKGVVSINTVMQVRGNVDNSTGDIDFLGDVVVNGDVLSGFKITSTGNITVKGTVEGATLNANGDITVSEGINGMNRGSITAGGNIRCRYIQSCYLKSGDSIFADSIMYCNIECNGNIELKGKRESLIGGRAAISKALICKTIGTDSHISTHIAMQNIDTTLADEKAQLQAKIKANAAEDLKLEQIMNRYTDLIRKGKVSKDMQQTIITANNNRIQLKQELAPLKERLAQVEKEQIRQNMENNCYIECKGRVHSGVTLSFGPLNMNVQQSFVFSRISLVNDEIAITALTKQ